MKKKKIAIIGTVGIPAKYGGFETLAEHLVRHMSDAFEITVYCTKKKYPRDQRPKEYLGAKLVYLPFDANGISSCWLQTINCTTTCVLRLMKSPLHLRGLLLERTLAI